MHFVNHVSSALDKKERTIAIFCDLRKAFDTVDHKILFKKLWKIGIRGAELLWFQDYLTNRKQVALLALLLQYAPGVYQYTPGVYQYAPSVY
jgi:Reverse transcriptase (RNA-dependent DNA polymerase)